MSRSLCFLLPFFLLCHARGSAQAHDREIVRETLFSEKGEEIMGAPSEGGNAREEFYSFRAPALAEVKGTIVAIVEAHARKQNRDFVGIATRSMSGHEGAWGAGDVLMNDSSDRMVERLLGPTAIVGNTTLHVYVGGYGASGQPLTSFDDDHYWSFKDVKGQLQEVNDGSGAFFHMNQTTTLMNKSISVPRRDFLAPRPEQESLKQFLGGGGAGIRMEDGTHVLPVQALKGDGRVVCLVITFRDFTNGWRLSEDMSVQDCIHPAVVEWGKGKLLMMTSCKDGYRKVFESTDKGKKWTEAVGTLSRVWGNTPARTGFGTQGGFITATIGNKTVMLFAQPMSFGKNALGQLRLWMTDGVHIYKAGLISHESENATAGSLLYEDNKLYCLYEVYNNGAHKVVFANLTVEVLRIRYALRIWTTLDKILSRRCGQNSAGSGNSRGKCPFPIPTAGLVGFLSNNSNRTHWKEGYRCVSATVSGATWVPNGLRFRGAGAGALWPVSGQEQNQRHHFANYAFTLVVTMAIHAVPSRDTPVLGASLGRGADDLLGLSVARGNRWKIVAKSAFSSVLSFFKKWEPHQTYHVAFTVQNGSGFVYIDGQPVWKGPLAASVGPVPRGISHFYLGGNGEMTGTNTYVTVTNVFLYNRVLNASEIEALFRNKVIIPKPEGAEGSSAGLKKFPEGTPEGGTGHPQPQPVNMGEDANDQLASYGVTTYVKGLHVRREIQIPREMLERMKPVIITSRVDETFWRLNENVDVTLRDRVDRVSLLLLCLLGLLILC